MDDKLVNAFNKFFHDSAVSEIRFKNSFTIDDKFTYNDTLYMAIIEGHPGEYTPSMIADMLYVSRPSVTQKINELEKKGFIEKRRNPHDKRNYNLYIKADIYKHLKQDNLQTKIADEVKKKFSTEEIDILCKTLDIVGECMLKENFGK